MLWGFLTKKGREKKIDLSDSALRWKLGPSMVNIAESQERMLEAAWEEKVTVGTTDSLEE